MKRHQEFKWAFRPAEGGWWGVVDRREGPSFRLDAVIAPDDGGVLAVEIKVLAPKGRAMGTWELLCSFPNTTPIDTVKQAAETALRLGMKNSWS